MHWCEHTDQVPFICIEPFLIGLWKHYILFLDTILGFIEARIIRSISNISLYVQRINTNVIFWTLSRYSNVSRCTCGYISTLWFCAASRCVATHLWSLPVRVDGLHVQADGLHLTACAQKLSCQLSTERLMHHIWKTIIRSLGASWAESYRRRQGLASAQCAAGTSGTAAPLLEQRGNMETQFSS